ncbi:polycystin family receptor for egg jelly-like isoform X3 [Mytilus edulis]|uniref:polycystin family receptor for egg jelly-like isoform X3 n=1 Tax=Mytilus edulis TaxID=6550 RepID=UPI0039EE97D1
MKNKLGIYLLIFVVTTETALSVLAGIGCYKENKRRRYFSRNPGDFDPGALTPTVCAAKCGSFKFSYAAIAEGRFCFCGDALPDNSLIDSSKCTDKCSGDVLQDCGSKDYVSVFTAAPPILGLTLASDAGSNVVQIGNEVTFSASISSGGANLAFKMDYDDGAGKTDQNATNLWKRTYNTPGHYRVSVYGNDQMESLMEKEATTSVMIDSPVKTYTLTCPAYMATHEEDFCTVSVLEGSNLELQYSVDSVLKSTFSIADPPIYITGPAIPTKGGTTVVPGETGTGSFIVMPASEFMYKSVVIGFEMYAEAIGNIDILIMSPACNTPSYCFDKNDCSSGCSGIHERSCISKEFCPSSMSCWTSGSSTCDTTPVRHDGTQRTNLNIVRTVTHNILATGYNYVPIDATADYIQVENGYILGYKPTTGRLNAVSANAIETDIKSTDVTNAGSAGPLSSPLKRHLLRAITSGGSDAYIPVIFTTSGIKDISITVSNKRISGSESNTTQINVMEGVDMAIINIPQYIEKGLATTFQLLPHTGTNVTYWWDFGDGITALNTTDATYDYTYTTVGEMNVSITAFNQMSSKSNMTIVQVQEKIRNLALVNSIAVVGETTSIPTSMTTGSNYTCTWKRDGVVIATTDDISSPPDGTFDYTFTEEGTYEISVVCSNQINSMSAVATFTTQFKITNLQLVKTGALKDSTFTIDWTWTAGSIPQFILEYDSQVRTFTKDPYFNKASSESLSAGSSITKYPLNLTAFNLVSNEQIVIDFGIEEELTGPSITIGGVSIDPVTGYGTISKNDQVSFTVDATGGTNVVIEWKYNDGTPDDSFTIPIWTATPAQTKNHQFSSLGWFNVEVKIYNLYNSHSQTFRLLAIAPIQNLVMNISPDPVLFLPPATVTFTFSKSVPTDPDPNEASVSFNYGDGKSETVPFDVNQQYTHEFRETSPSGTYTITTNISNVISHLILNGNVKVVEKIEDVEIVPDPEYAAVGDPVNVKVTMRRGDTGADLTLDWDLGDGTAVTSGNRIGVSPSGSDTKVATYPTEGTRTIKITAKSTMETIVTTKDIICQLKITEDPVVTSNHPQNFNLVGGRIDFTFLYSGTPAPTAATVLVNYGDGTEEYQDPTWLTTKKGSTQLFDHTYTTDGNYVTTVTLSNLVSTKILQISSGVYLKFVGLAVVPKFIKFIPINGPDVDGFGSSKDIFQLDRPVRFHMSKTEGTFVYYSISASNGAVVIMCNKTTEDVFEIKFNETGTYTVVITAHNPIDSKSVTTTIEVMKAVLDVSVADNGQTTSENEAKLFDISFVEPGTKTCVHIDYGDGIAEMFGDSATCTSSSYAGSATYISTFSGSSFQATHTYTSKNTYDVRVHAFNAHSTSDYSVFHVVSSIDCSQPQIDIKNKYVKFWEPEEIEKSSRIRVIGVTKIDCGSLLQNVKQWSVESVDEQYGTTMSSIDLGSIDSRLKAELDLPSLFLNTGLYKISYTMEMEADLFANNETFKSTAVTYLKVKSSTLVVKIFSGGMTKIQRGINTMVTIDPYSNSYDPDVPKGSSQTFTNFTWYCREVGESWPVPMTVSSPYSTADLPSVAIDNGGCFKQGPGQIDTNVGSLTFDTGNMKINKTYEFKVVAYKNDHDPAEASAFVTIVDGIPPEIEIKCSNEELCVPTVDGLRIAPSTRLGLLGHCSTGCDSNTKYEWKIYTADHQWIWKEVLELPTHSDGINSMNIAIRKELFSLNPDVTQYQVSISATTSAGDSGTAFTNLILNKPPSGGTCSITPKVGTVLQTQKFDITCSGWTDEDGIAEYQMYCKFKEDQVLKQIYFGSDNFYHGDMPLGPEYDDYKMLCYVRIKDKTGSFMTFDLGEVQVNPLPLGNVTELFKTMENNIADSFDKVAAEGNVNSINSLALAYSTLIKYDNLDIAARETSTGMGPDYTDRSSAFTTTTMDPDTEKKLKEEYEAKRNTRAEFTSQILGALENCTIATTSAIALTGSTMAELTQFSENCARDCQEKAADLAVSMTNKLEELASTSSKEETIEACEGVLAALANVEEAGNVHKNNPTTGDKEKVKPFAHYDTDLESPKKAMPVGLTDLSDGDDMLLLYTSQDVQVGTSAKTKSTEKRILNLIRNVLQDTLVPGEQPVIIATPKMTVQFEKNSAEQLANKSIEVGNAKVDLPTWCDMQPAPCDNSKTVMMQTKFTTYAPYQDTETSSQISPRSGSISIDFYDDAGSTIGVNLSPDVDPIELYIPLDRLMPKPTPEYVAPYIPDRNWEFFYYHTTEITLDRGSLHITLNIEDTSAQFSLVIRLGAFPNITSREFDFTCLVGPSTGAASVADGSLTNECFISSDEINGYKGKVYIGVREVRPYELERYRSKDLIPTSFPKADNFFTTNYTITTFSASCNYYSVTNKRWQTDGCNVGPKTDTSLTHCLCTHLTTFAGGWVVTPNTIDWNFVFSNADFLKNPTLYITMIVISVLYLVVVIWARRQDKKDIEKLGLTPLVDNDKMDKYFYEIVVVTGMRRKAGTDSKVQFILSGEDDETDVRPLSDSKRKVLRRGTVDGFLMSAPRPLGALNYLHIWHDNSGKGTMASWYLRSVVIRDVQTDEKFIFISNRWFAVEEDDGQIDRVIPVAGKEQMTEFSHLFTEKTTKSLSDGHLWFSVVARPPQSRFTRVQRVSCCLCLLYLSMLTNAMFYEKDEGAKTYTFGPFALSPEQIYIGVLSNIIVFPVTFLIITLFRKSRPKNKRPSRVQTALNNTTKRATSMTDVNPTLENTREGTLTPSILLEQKNRPDTSMSRGYTSLSVGDLANKPSGKKRKKKMDLPWYFVIFGWILLWSATFVSGAFVIFYGIQFQDVKCQKWITSMLISFISSIFVTQPIKVFLTAIVLSLLVKNPGADDDEDEDDEEKPHISADDPLLHEDSIFSATRPKRAAYAPPDPVLVEKARQVRLQEIKMWSVVRELVFYSFFLWILMVISYRNRSELMYTYKNSMEQVFIVTNDTNHWFMKAKNQDDFWSWAKSGMGNGLRALNYYNDEQPLFLRGYINDKQSRIMGYATMRQLRVTRGSCKVPDQVVGIIHECNDEYSVHNQDENSYEPGWKPLTGNTSREEYRYTTANELEGYPYWGEVSMYSGGGYVVRLRGNVSTLRNKMIELQEEGWIDRYTRAVFVEFTVYNPGINLFAVSTMLAEFRPSQGIVPSYRFEPVNLFPYMNSAMLFVLACEFSYLLFTVYFIFAEARNIYKQKLSYFKEFWNLVELGICAMSVTAVVIYFYRMFETNKLTERFKVSHGNEYMKFQYVGYWSEIFSYIVGWLAFFATLKFLKLLRFNKKICLLASTIKASARDLLHFSVIFNIVFLAFIQLFYMIYVANIKSFKTFVTSCESGVVMMMGKFDIYAMSNAQPVLTQVFLFLYVVVITFIVVNMFLSILNQSFSAVRIDANKQNNDYEIVQFMLGRLKLWTGVGTPDKNVLKPNSVHAADTRGPTELFPDQIDRLLHSISHIYMEKERLDELFDKNAYGKRKGADLPMYDPPSVRSLKYEKMTMVQT